MVMVFSFGNINSHQFSLLIKGEIISAYKVEFLKLDELNYENSSRCKLQHNFPSKKLLLLPTADTNIILDFLKHLHMANNLREKK